MSLDVVESLMRDSAFEELTDYTHQFEPFKTLGIHRKELVHSRILATFLNRNESHKLGADFLNAFVMALVKPGAVLFSGEPLEPDELSKVFAPSVHSQVYRELYFIDLVIVFPRQRLVIGIENKVDAGEQEDQISRYQETLRTRFAGFRQALVFLTPDGRTPKTANAQGGVPVYCMGYGQIAGMFRACMASPRLSAGAGAFIDQFVNHIELHMTGNTRTQELCWQLFSKNEAAYKEIVRQYRSCIERKVVSALSGLADRLASDSILSVDPTQLQIERERSKDDKAIIFYSLHIRMIGWPEGVWVKIYKHNWLGVFPFIHEADLAKFGPRFPLPVSATTARNWQELRYVSARSGMDEARKVLGDGNEFTQDDLDIALALAADYVREINEALELQLADSASSQAGGSLQKIIEG